MCPKRVHWDLSKTTRWKRETPIKLEWEESLAKFQTLHKNVKQAYLSYGHEKVKPAKDFGL